MTFSPAQLRKLAIARRRPAFLRVGELPSCLVTDCVAFWCEHQSENILSQAIAARRASNVPMAGDAYLTDHYGQVAVKMPPESDHSDVGDGASNSDHEATSLAERIEQIVGPCRRIRIAALAPGGEIPEHIDNPDQSRVLAVLQGHHDFTLTEKSRCHRLDMKIGELWFVNTAWPHAVRNTSEETRVALLLDVIEDLPHA